LSLPATDRRSFLRIAGLAAVGFLAPFPILGQTKDDKERPKIKNPLIDEPGMSDPHMLVVGDVMYVFTGRDIGFDTEKWVMPDWRIYRSTDLQSWEHVGTIDPSQNYMGAGSTSCWACDIIERNGKFYFYFSKGSLGIGVMVADKPEGPYVDVRGKHLVKKHDPAVFIDDDGTPYLIWGSRGYQIARLQDSMTELAEEPRLIEQTYETEGVEGKFPSTDKASIHKHNGIYYLGCSGYYATSDNIYGPYKYRGVISKELGLATSYGHGDYFKWKGDWYYVWTKYQNRKKNRVRDSFVAPVKHQPDGTILLDESVFSPEVLALPDV
jgi:beta-xylosidase